MLIMSNVFKTFLTEQFKLLINKYSGSVETEDPREIVQNTNYVNDFIEFYTNYNNIITDCFQTNHHFNIIFKEVLESVQMNNKFNTSYILPFYLDKYMKRSFSTSDSSLIITQVFNIFMSVPEKDVFIEIHRTLLSKRLLSDDYNSLENEKIFIGKLKIACGVTYTSNVEVMLSDFTNSRDLNDSYKNWAKEKVIEGLNGIEFQVRD